MIFALQKKILYNPVYPVEKDFTGKSLDILDI